MELGIQQAADNSSSESSTGLEIQLVADDLSSGDVWRTQLDGQSNREEQLPMFVD